jgi:hypothetical protein
MLNENKLKQRPANSTYKKLAVQCLNQALCFISSSLLAESYVLRNSQLLEGAKRQAVKKLLFFTIFHPKLLFYFRFKSL